MKAPSASKLCPTCWNDMRRTPEGWVCTRHGLVKAVSERGAKPKQSDRKPSSSKPLLPRETQQTKRIAMRQDEILARNSAGESLAAIAEDLWKDLGYKNPDICASKISHFLSRRGLRPAIHRSGPPQGSMPTSRFTLERLTELRTAISSGVPVWAFAGVHWEEWGFTSRRSCDSLLRKWLREGVGR